MGSDIESGPIWYDYIEFLKEGDVTGTWEAQQKMDKLRQTYQRAVCIPLANVEQIWQGYDAFENNLNRATVSSACVRFHISQSIAEHCLIVLSHAHRRRDSYKIVHQHT